MIPARILPHNDRTNAKSNQRAWYGPALVRHRLAQRAVSWRAGRLTHADLTPAEREELAVYLVEHPPYRRPR